MRTLFDQYVHHENRLTHALAASLSEDPALLRSFLQWLELTPPREPLSIVEQRLPGEPDVRSETSEFDERRLPDAWIYSRERWALLIESKIRSPIDNAQLKGHLVMAARRDFDDARLLVLSPVAPRTLLPMRCMHRCWSDLYRWTCGQTRSSAWARHLSGYMPVAEERMIEDEYLRDGALTTFSGIPFDADRPYTYLEAKRLLRLLMAELREDTHLDPVGADRSRPGRKAITGSGQDSIWDRLSLNVPAEATGCRPPHFTLALHRDCAIAQLTLPNAMSTARRRALINGGYEGFRAALKEFVDTAAPILADDPGALPRIFTSQQHYLGQQVAVHDAELEFDPRTAFGGYGPIKVQEEWLRATYAALASPRSNIEVGVGIKFTYATSTLVKTEALTAAISAAWRATAPLIVRIMPELQNAASASICA